MSRYRRCRDIVVFGLMPETVGTFESSRENRRAWVDPEGQCVGAAYHGSDDLRSDGGEESHRASRRGAR